MSNHENQPQDPHNRVNGSSAYFSAKFNTAMSAGLALIACGESFAGVEGPAVDAMVMASGATAVAAVFSGAAAFAMNRRRNR